MRWRLRRAWDGISIFFEVWGMLLLNILAIILALISIAYHQFGWRPFGAEDPKGTEKPGSVEVLDIRVHRGRESYMAYLSAAE